MIERAKGILKSVFGYDRFISLQQDVIENVLRRKDCLVVMPTGGGKSLCYQVPALVFDGLTIVVSPLISLMKDQVEQLTELGAPVALLNSSLSAQDYRRNVEHIRTGRAKLLYAAPETLMKSNLQALLKTVQVACLAIDEAHCISEWGPDFRPEYRRLTEVRALFPDAVCMALTATATPRVREDIKTCLGFDDSSEFVAGFNRENLFIRVIPKENPFNQTVHFLNQFPDESGIIYCLTRKQVDDLCTALQQKGFSVSPYHAGLSETERHHNQERFVRDEVPIIAATIAFGMGIDKSNIRFVLHYDLPKSIESYYQEIGRAGRDGMRADCLLLLSYGDIFKIKAFIDKKEGRDKRAANLQLNALLQLAEAEVCRRIPLLDYFGEKFPHQTCGMCDNCLAGIRELVDVTVPAQKFLSCVKRTGELFGAVHIIDVLLGSRARKVLRHGHDRLSTYGIGKEYSHRQWQQLARQFLHKGLMTQDAEYGSLKLTAKAWQVFRGDEAVFARLDDPAETARQSAESGAARAFEYDLELFEALRRKRKELAEAANVPPYVVFSDKTLAHMATYFPQTPERMLEIHGVGRAKMERYGSPFLEVIKDHCRDRPPATRPPGSLQTSVQQPESTRPKRHLIVGRAYNAGQSVQSLAQQFSIKEHTVLDHLYKCRQEGFSLRPEGLLPLLTIPERQLTAALDAFKQLGWHYLLPVFEALQEEVGYDDLKAVRLYYLSRLESGVPVESTAPHRSQAIKKIVCLANSRKYSGRCIAGKELSGEGIGGWIRPVSREPTGELSLDDIALQQGRLPKLLDILTVPMQQSCPHTYQAENYFIGSGRWWSTGAFPLLQTPLLCDEADCLWINGYHSHSGLNDRMPVELANDVLSSSLLFIRPDRLCITVGEGSRGLKKVRAKFTYRDETYWLTVTDPVIEAEYMQRDMGEYPAECPRSYLTVSIGEPFEGFCYKLVAALLTMEEA